MHFNKVAPWESYPKHLKFTEVMDPLTVVEGFFSAGRPEEHRRDLKKWRYYVVNDKYYKDQNGAAGILFIHNETVQFIEAMYLLLLKDRDRWPELEDVSEEQIKEEKKKWLYFPRNLSQKEIKNPYRALRKCFKKISLHQYREYLYEWLYIALYDHAADETMTAGEILRLYRNIRKLYSAGWLIHLREIKETMGQYSKVGKAAIKEISAGEPVPLKNLNHEIRNAEKLRLEELKNIIVDRIPCVRLIYHIGTRGNLPTYYLAVIIDDKEKTPEHEIANKIEDNCRHLAVVFVIVHKLKTVQEALTKDKRFWNNTVYKSINIYSDPSTKLTGSKAISDKIWLERAGQNWNRWGTQGKEFMKGAVRYMEDNNYRLALFCIHQAAESSLMAIVKAVLGYRFSAHNLSRMITMTVLFTDEIKEAAKFDTAEGDKLFNLLQTAYSEARYKSEYQPDEHSVKLLQEKVEVLVATIENVYLGFVKEKRMGG